MILAANLVGMSEELPMITIPVCFMDETPLRRLAVNEQGLIHLLSLDDGRSLLAAKRSAYLFRRVNKIRTLPGGVYSLWEIENALKTTPIHRRITT
jgi:hypothetical protein